MDNAKEPKVQQVTKEELLEHYKQREPHRFIQYDGFIAWFEDDHADSDGDTVWCRETVELMQGSTVRLLIDPDAAKDVVIRVLRKLCGWIERDGVFNPEEADLMLLEAFTERQHPIISNEAIQELKDDIIPF